MIATTRSTTEARMVPMLPDGALTIRWARADDAIDIKRLAQLDSQSVPSGPLLLAEVDDDLVALLAVRGDETIANPFRRTEHIVALLRLSLNQRQARRHPRRNRWQPVRLRPRPSVARS